MSSSSSPSSQQTTLPKSVDEFLSITGSAENAKLLYILNFKAVWCAPCKAMAPFVTYLQNEYSAYTKFHMIDIEDPELEEYPAKFQIVKVPTFILIKNGNIVGSMIGTDKQKLEDLIGEYISM
jgi:thioredoxin 1